MATKMSLVFVILLFIISSQGCVSCSREISEQEQLIRDLIHEPEKAMEICLDSSIGLGERMKEVMTFDEGRGFTEILMMFNGTYKFQSMIESTLGDSTSVMKIYITDSNDQNLTQFVFLQREEGWLFWLVHHGGDDKRVPSRNQESL